MSKKVLYIGNFILPDRNAAAHRVLNIAKSLRDLNYEVVFFGMGETHLSESISYADGFAYYNVFTTQKGEHFREMLRINHIKSYVELNPDVEMIISYNYPSIALARIVRFCRKKNIRVISDCTEWYDASGNGFISRLLKQTDTYLRMKYVHKHIDGIISISKYLHNYYKDCIPSVIIPPTVDLSSSKYTGITKSKSQDENMVTIVYSGSPSSSKESLGLVVSCMNGLTNNNIQLYVVGITLEQFVRMYNIEPETDKVKFLGRVEHEKALQIISDSDYALVIRPDSRLTRAGFPTKFVEAISCGTPVIATNTSDLSEYLADGKNGFLTTVENLDKLLSEISEGKTAPQVEKNRFDYRNYTEVLALFLKKLGVNN